MPLNETASSPERIKVRTTSTSTRTADECYWFITNWAILSGQKPSSNYYKARLGKKWIYGAYACFKQTTNEKIPDKNSNYLIPVFNGRFACCFCGYADCG